MKSKASTALGVASLALGSASFLMFAIGRPDLGVPALAAAAILVAAAESLRIRA